MGNNILMVKFWPNSRASKNEAMQEGLWVDTVRGNRASFAIIVDSKGKIKDVPIRLVQVVPPKRLSAFSEILKEKLEKEKNRDLK